MSKTFVQNKYNPGDIVVAKSNPKLQLVIRRYIDRIYYCRAKDDQEGKEFAYFDRELIEDEDLIKKNRTQATADQKS